MTQQALTQPARQHPGGEIRRSVLPGGLRLVTEHVPGSRSLDLGFFVAVGSRDEPRELHGASHFLEHVLFKGTATRSAREISESIEAHGGDFNAYTSREYTCFHARVLAERGSETVELFGDMLSNSLVRPQDVAVERDVILDEIAMHADDPGEVAWDLLVAQLFAGTPLAPRVIGSSRSVARASAARVRDYWRTHYTSDRIVVSLVGELDHDAMRAQLLGLDAALASPASRLRSRQPAVLAPRRRVSTSATEISQTSVVLGFEGVPLGHPDREALVVASVVLGGGMSSRLFQEVREKRALAYSIDCSHSSWTDAGVFTIDWQALPERTGEIMEAVQRIVADVRRDGFTPDELDAARGQLVGQTILHHESPSARMSLLGTEELSGERQGLGALLDAYRSVDLQQLNAVARRALAQPPAIAMAGAASQSAAARRLQRTW